MKKDQLNGQAIAEFIRLSERVGTLLRTYDELRTQQRTYHEAHKAREAERETR